MADAAGRLDQLRQEAESGIRAAGSSAELEELRVRYLGRRSELTGVLRSIGGLSPEERGPVGQAANAVRSALESLLRERAATLEAAELDARLARDRIDVTLPGDPPAALGHLHLITQTRREIEDVFLGLGFSIAEGPEVEYDYYNFTALNMPPDHPARAMQDTFYVSDEVVLRTHTSPVQIRAMEVQEPPIYVIVPGKVYRRDSDATHSAMFHQVEGLAVDEDITLGDLQGVLLEFARAIFGQEREIQVRSSYWEWRTRAPSWSARCCRPSRTRTRTGSASAGSTTARAWSARLSAEPRTWPRARPWRSRGRARRCRTAQRSAKRSCGASSRAG